MTTRMTKTWFDGENIITQEIPEAEIYEREWVGLTDEDWEEVADMPDTFDQGVAWAQARLKERNT